ncbi:MAG: LptF/LptG family permease [Deltaproteobacteria bacterium]|nr:LptF/LptG family permease [Deltaproteobacteria bacterium]
MFRRTLPILDREIARAIAIPTALAAVLFTAIFALFHLSRIADVTLDVVLSFADFARLMATLVPHFLSLTFPLAFVFGVFVAYGDLRASGEWVALRAIGVSLHRAIRPALVLGAIVLAVGLALSNFAEPGGKRRLKDLIRSVAVDVLPTTVRTKVFQSLTTGVLLYVGDRTSSGELKDVVLIDQRNVDNARTIFATTGRIARLEAESGGGYAGMTIVLRDGVIEEFRENQTVERRARFRHLELPVDLQGELGRRTRFLAEFEEWSTPLLTNQIAALRKAGEKVAPLEIALHQRFAIPVAALLFVVMGVPLALAGGGGKRSLSVVLSVVLVGSYYVLLRTSDGLAGSVPSWLAGWGPNIVFAGAAVAVYAWVSRR